jgi:hypothetical protein
MSCPEEVEEALFCRSCPEALLALSSTLEAELGANVFLRVSIDVSPTSSKGFLTSAVVEEEAPLLEASSELASLLFGEELAALLSL